MDTLIHPVAEAEPVAGAAADSGYRTLDVVACSPTGIEEAIRGAIERAGKALPHVDWFEVTDLRGTVVNGRVGRWQVGLRLGYRLEGGAADRNSLPQGPVAKA